MSKKKSTTGNEQAQDGSLLEQLTYTTFEGWGVPIKADPTSDTREDVIWMTQREMAILFGVGVPTINHHLRKIFREGELREDSTIRNFRIVLPNGRFYNALHYKLKAIIHVGFRISSDRAQEFRRWADTILEEYIVEGYALNEARLKQDPEALQKLSARIDELRNTEIDGYTVIRSFFKTATSDYDPRSNFSRFFYANLQNLFTYAITRKSSAEILLDRADHSRPNMGLMCIKGKHPTSAEIEVAKNYLNEKELISLQELNGHCKLFLTAIKACLANGVVPTMLEYGAKVEEFFKLCEYPIFLGYEYAGSLRSEAKVHAHKEFARYTNLRRLAAPRPNGSNKPLR